MGWRVLLFLAIVNGAALADSCEMNVWSIPGRSGIICYVKACENENDDCSPPKIEPDLRFDVVDVFAGNLSKCEDAALGSKNCMTLELVIRIKLAASDPSGIKALGVKTEMVIGEKITHGTFWSNEKNHEDDRAVITTATAPATTPTTKRVALPDMDGVVVANSAGPANPPLTTVEMFKTVTTQVPAGQGAEIWATYLCAIDTLNNQRCKPFRAPARPVPESAKR